MFWNMKRKVNMEKLRLMWIIECVLIKFVEFYLLLINIFCYFFLCSKLSGELNFKIILINYDNLL